MDGEVRDNSEIRRDVTAYINEDGSYDFERGDTRTEVMTPADLASTKSKWQRDRDIDQQYYAPDQFENLAGEYYGQQALKLAGMKAPNLDQMDYTNRGLAMDSREAVKQKGINGKDRLIIDNTGINAPEVFQNGKPSDYRYVTPEGNVIVGDYQRADDDGSLRMNLAKASGFSENDIQMLERKLVEVAQKTKSTDFDEIFATAINEMGLEVGSSVAKASQRSNKQLRAGKGLSSGEIMGAEHQWNDNIKTNEVVYGLNKGSVQPQDIKVVDTEEFRKQAAQDLLAGKLPDLFTMGKGGIEMKIETPSRSLLDADQMAQINEPYALDKPMQKIARPKRASEMTAQERYEARQIKLQQRLGGPRAGKPIQTSPSGTPKVKAQHPYQTTYRLKKEDLENYGKDRFLGNY